MFESYSVFLRRSASDALKGIRGARRLAVERFIDYLVENPYEEGDFSEIDSSGRKVYCKIVRDYAISFYPDHAVKELKIIEIVRTP